MLKYKVVGRNSKARTRQEMAGNVGQGNRFCPAKGGHFHYDVRMARSSFFSRIAEKIAEMPPQMWLMGRDLGRSSNQQVQSTRDFQPGMGADKRELGTAPPPRFF